MKHAPGSCEHAHPPRLALRLLELILPERDQEGLIGDLIEEYEGLAESRSAAAARRWLWWQALHSIAPMLGRRLALALRRAMAPAEALQLRAVAEGANMFERSMLDASGSRPARRLWPVPAAVGLHLFLVAGLALARAWSLEELPAPRIQEAYVPVALLPPPPPPRGEAKKPRVPKPVRIKAPRPSVSVQQPVVVPPSIPEPEAPQSELAPVDFELPEAAFDGSGHPDGVRHGVPNGDPNGIGAGDPGPIFVQGEVQPPQLILRVEPRYTELGVKAGLQGVVYIEAIIDKQGKVTNARVLRGLGAGLSESALEAVQQWKWKPATLNGRPVTVYFTVHVKFQLLR
jgi:protein TonB